MKKTTFLVVLLCALFTFNFYAQQRPTPTLGYCGTISQTPIVPLARPGTTITIQDHYCYRIYVHVIRRSDGTGGQSVENVNRSISILRNNFSPLDISFHWDEQINYIDDTSKYDNNNNAIFNELNHTDGIDIYLFSDNALPANGFANEGFSQVRIGGTFNIPSPSPMVTSPVISHEIGHVLGLLHTTGNACPTLQPACTQQDLVCDTPLDPGLYFDNVDPVTHVWDGGSTIPTDTGFITCEDTDPTTPLLSSIYNPDTRNIMAYVPIPSLQCFTQGQGQRMKEFTEVVPVGYSYLSDVVVDNCPDTCTPFPKRFEVCGSPKQNPYTLVTDSNNDILLANSTQNSTVYLDGTEVTYQYFIAKYNEAGCLDWVRSAVGEGEIKIDGSNNIYHMVPGVAGTNSILSKYSSSGALQWSISSPLGTNWSSSHLSQNNIYLSGRNSNGYITRIFKVDPSNGVSVELNSSLPSQGFMIRNIFSSDTTNEITIDGSYGHDGNNTASAFTFGATTVNPPTYVPGNWIPNYFLLKYTISGTIITPVKAQMINVNTQVDFNESSNRLFVYNHNLGTLDILDHNYNNLNQISVVANGKMTVKESINTILILENDGSSIDKVLDDTMNVVNNVSLNVPDIQNLYSLINFDPSSNSKLYISWVTNNAWSINFQKYDLNTGAILNIAPPLDDEIISSEEEEEEETNSDATIYPNPFKGSITIKQPLNTSISGFTILDKSGRKLIKKELLPLLVDPIVNTSQLAKGIYFIKIDYANGSSETKQIIKE